MAAIEDGAGKRPTGRLAERLEVLHRIVVEEPSAERAWQLERVLQRLTLLRRMVDRLGVDETRDPLSMLLVAKAEATCFDCDNAARCRRWLDAGGEGADYRSFCVNAALLEHLSGIAGG